MSPSTLLGILSLSKDKQKGYPRMWYAPERVEWLPGTDPRSIGAKWLIPILSGLYQLSFNQVLDRFSAFPGLQLFLSTHGL